MSKPEPLNQDPNDIVNPPTLKGQDEVDIFQLENTFSSLSPEQPQTTEKGIGSRKGLKIGMGVSWTTVIAGIAAAAVTLVLMLASPIAIPLYAVLIPAGIALALSIPAIITTVLHNKNKANNQEQPSSAQAQNQNTNNDDNNQENPIWGADDNLSEIENDKNSQQANEINNLQNNEDPLTEDFEEGM